MECGAENAGANCDEVVVRAGGAGTEDFVKNCAKEDGGALADAMRNDVVNGAAKKMDGSITRGAKADFDEGLDAELIIAAGISKDEPGQDAQQHCVTGGHAVDANTYQELTDNANDEDKHVLSCASAPAGGPVGASRTRCLRGQVGARQRGRGAGPRLQAEGRPPPAEGRRRGGRRLRQL